MAMRICSGCFVILALCSVANSEAQGQRMPASRFATNQPAAVAPFVAEPSPQSRGRLLKAGAATGTVAGGIIGYQRHKDTESFFGPTPHVMFYAAIGMLSGALLGLLLYRFLY